MRTLLLVLFASISTVFGGTTEKLQPGEKVLVVFSAKESGLDGMYAISKDGTLNLPFVGRVRIAGQSTGEAGKVIEKAYIDQKIYSRLSVQVTPTKANLMILRDPDSGNLRYLSVPDGSKPSGDYYSPEEKKKLFRLDQLETRNMK